MFGDFGIRFRTGGWLVLTLLVAGVGAAPAGAQDLTQQERQRMYQQVKPAVVLVQTQITGHIQIQLDGQTLSGQHQVGGSGSGWLITPDGYLVTNGHVVAQYHDENEEQLKQQMLFHFIQESYLPQVQQYLGRELTQEELILIIPELVQRAQVGLIKNLQVVLQNGDRYTAEVKQYSAGMEALPGRISFPGVSFESGKDVALVKIEGRDLPTVALGNSAELSAGDDLYVAGYPGVVQSHPYLSERTQLEPSFTRGSVSSLRTAVGGAEVMQMDASTTWGNSGGPVFNSRGEVVGMTTFGSIAQQADGSAQAIQGFNFAVPTQTIMEFVRAEGVTPTTEGLFNRTWTTALDAYHAGRWSAAVEGFDEVLRVHAGLPDAIQLRSQAVAQRGTETGVPVTIIALVLAGFALVVLGFVMRQRAQPQPAMAGAAVGGMPGPARIGAVTGRKALAAGARLVVSDGPLRGNRFDIPQSGIKIGRDPDRCQVVLSETATSREHAVVVPTGGGGEVTVRNLSGTNPTFVNGRPIQETTLSPGDRIRIAGTTLTFERE
jgi:serine protease Do